MQLITPAAGSDEELEKLGRSFQVAFPLTLYRMQRLAAVHALLPEAVAIVADHLSGGIYD